MSRSGPTPFGYRRRDGRLVPEPDEAHVRVKIYDLFIVHQRKKTVAEILNAKGYRTRSGALFSGQTIGRLLNDKSVIGIPGEVDALIGREIFGKCQAILQSQKTKGVSRKPRHIFAGVAHCNCGGKMRVPSGSKKYVCTDCKDKIYASDIEVIFLEQLRLQKQPELQTLSLKWPDMELDDKLSVVSITTMRIDINSQSNNVIVTFLGVFD